MWGYVMWVDEPFDLDLPAPIVKQARHAPEGKIVWSKYRPAKPVHCDDCLAEIHEKWPVNMLPFRALFKRTAAGRTVYLCALHAEPQRVKDGVKPGRQTK